MEKEINPLLFTNPLYPAYTLVDAEPFLREYFGLSYGNFQDEIQRSTELYCEAYRQVAMEEFKQIPRKEIYEFLIDIEAYAKKGGSFLCATDRFDFKSFSDLLPPIIKEKENEIDETKRKITRVLYFVTLYIMNGHKIGEMPEDSMAEAIEYDLYTHVREDILKLYEWVQTNERIQKITIQHSTGSISLENCDNWIKERLLKPYMKEYFPEITSIEQAKEELQKCRKKAGRKYDNAPLNIIVYGIYRLFSEQLPMDKKCPDFLCKFIISYLNFLNIQRKDGDEHDTINIRAQIDYMAKRGKSLVFDIMESAVPCSLDELRNAGQILC